MLSNETLVLLLVVILPAALLWGVFIARTGGFGRRGRPTLGIPRALRPGQTDDVLEGRRLERILWGGVASVAVLAVFVPAYWLPETSRQESFVERFDEESLHRGKFVYSAPKPLEEGISAVAFKEEEEAIALAMGCANCHGSPGGEGALGGGLVLGGFKDPATGKIVKYKAPPLNSVFQRWDEEVVRFTIERGRPGTPMPTWGVQYGGPMTAQMVTDVIAFIRSQPGNQTGPEISEGCADPQPFQYASCGKEIFEVRCAVCHGPEGQGKEEEGLTAQEIADRTGMDVAQAGSLTAVQEEAIGKPPEIPPNEAAAEVLAEIGTWYQGMALWQGDVGHLGANLHFTTIFNGRRFAFMPPHGEAPAQGIPAPLYPLLDSQIQAVMAYERSL